MSQASPCFVSAVIYFNEADIETNPLIETRLEEIAKDLCDDFAHSEVVVVFDGPSEGRPAERLRSVKQQVMLVFMGKKQGIEASMNAGIDAAVGDFVLEVDHIGAYDRTFTKEAFRLIEEGSDIVFGESSRISRKGRLFYPLFNRFSGSKGNLATGHIRLVSRRAINRAHSMSSYMPYRKAAYVASGLGTTSIKSLAESSPSQSDLSLAIDSMALYTDLFLRVSIGVSVAMSVLSLLELIYVVAILIAGNAIEGWVTTMLVLTVGFLGLFVLFSFALKYLDLLVKSNFNSQPYLIEGIRKSSESL